MQSQANKNMLAAMQKAIDTASPQRNLASSLKKSPGRPKYEVPQKVTFCPDNSDDTLPAAVDEVILSQALQSQDFSTRDPEFTDAIEKLQLSY